MNDPITVTRLDSTGSFDALSAGWDALLTSSSTASVFSTYGWLRTWWRHFGDGNQLYLLLCHKGEELVAAAPFMQLGPPGRVRRSIEFLGTPSADYADIIGAVTPEILEAIFGYLRSHGAHWDRVVLTQLPQDSDTVRLAPDVLRACRSPYRLRPIERASRLVFQGSDEERTVFSIRRNRTMRKKLHFLERLGKVNYRRLTTADEISPHLAALFHCHISRWRDTAWPSKFLDSRHRLFYEDLVNALAPHGEVFLSALTLDQLPLAYLFGYRCGTAAYLYTIASSSYYARKSSGITAYLYTTEDLIRDGCRSVDFGRGEHEHKELFVNETATNYELEIFGSPVRRRLVGLYDGLKSAPAARRVVRAGWAQRLKQRWRQEAAETGIRRGIARALRACTRQVFEIRRLRILARAADAPPAALPGPAVEELPAGAIAELANFLGLCDDAPEVLVLKEAYERGDVCWAARLQGQIVAVVWTRRGLAPLAPLQGALQLRPSDVCLSGFSVSPLVARSLVEKPLLTMAIRRSSEEGSRLLALCPPADLAGVAALEELGFTRLVTLREPRLFGRAVSATHRLA